eukprot:TRINITY_DN21850_c1_g1_i1.p2 TRINITY_DN21850_c1_g1~~TRINITY_DN21850_c1_g1_i1.p2  ORF type:complete len:325 (+),score=64.18 TRINITY_DN21850_c1_g1_i1:105-1079(+)
MPIWIKVCPVAELVGAVLAQYGSYVAGPDYALTSLSPQSPPRCPCSGSDSGAAAEFKGLGVELTLGHVAAWVAVVAFLTLLAVHRSNLEARLEVLQNGPPPTFGLSQMGGDAEGAEEGQRAELPEWTVPGVWTVTARQGMCLIPLVDTGESQRYPGLTAAALPRRGDFVLVKEFTLDWQWACLSLGPDRDCWVRAFADDAALGGHLVHLDKPAQGGLSHKLFVATADLQAAAVGALAVGEAQAVKLLRGVKDVLTRGTAMAGPQARPMPQDFHEAARLYSALFELQGGLEHVAALVEKCPAARGAALQLWHEHLPHRHCPFGSH